MSGPQEPVRILVIDDEEVTRHVAVSLLLAARYTDVVEGRSAAECFAALGIDPPRDEPSGVDLILMDIGLPGMNGIDAIRRIRSVPRYADLPILVVTATEERELVEVAFDLGAVDFMKKPLERTELLGRVRAALRLHREMELRKAHERELEAANAKLAEANRILEDLAAVDPLTGVFNRRHIDAVMLREWRRETRSTNPLSVIMVDIDHFKMFNDTYGHQAGDACLIRVAQALRTALKRAGDTVGRYGGEEFLVILPETPAQGAVMLAEEMRSRVEELRIEHTASQTNHHVTISLGLSSTIPTQETPAAKVIAAADRALYQAKRAGRNRVSVQVLD